MGTVKPFQAVWSLELPGIWSRQFCGRLADSLRNGLKLLQKSCKYLSESLGNKLMTWYPMSPEYFHVYFSTHEGIFLRDHNARVKSRSSCYSLPTVLSSPPSPFPIFPVMSFSVKGYGPESCVVLSHLFSLLQYGMCSFISYRLSWS